MARQADGAHIIHPYGPRGKMGAVVHCTRESGNTHLGPNQGQI